MNRPFPHIQFERMADLVEGRLAGDELLQAQTHLGRCEDCAEQRARLEDAIKMMRTDGLEDPPQEAVGVALRAFRSRAGREPSLLKRLVAAVTFDSLQAAPATGVRSMTSAGRHVFFCAGPTRLHIQIMPRGEDWVVSGQVLGECSGGIIEVSNAFSTVRVALNATCEFELPPLGKGSYEVVLRIQEAEIEIPELTLGA